MAREISENERKARESDIDESKPIIQIARKVAEELNANPLTIRNYISAKRDGYQSYRDYRDNIAQRMGMPSQTAYIESRKTNKKVAANS